MIELEKHKVRVILTLNESGMYEVREMDAYPADVVERMFFEVFTDADDLDLLESLRKTLQRYGFERRTGPHFYQKNYQLTKFKIIESYHKGSYFVIVYQQKDEAHLHIHHGNFFEDTTSHISDTTSIMNTILAAQEPQND